MGSRPGRSAFHAGTVCPGFGSLVDEKGLEQADILGFSDGANIALLFALRHPRRVGRLILNGANLFPKGVKNSVQLPIVMGYLMVSLIALFSKKAVPNKEMLGIDGDAAAY